MAISTCEEALEWLEKGSIELTEAESHIVDYLRQFKNIQYRWDGLKYTVTTQDNMENFVHMYTNKLISASELMKKLGL